MPLSEINKVRSRVGDNDKSSLNELVAKGTAIGRLYKLDMFPVRTGSVNIFISGIAKATAPAINELVGTVDFTGTSAITAGAEVRANYNYNALSDDEIQDNIDQASGDGVVIAAALAARSLAGQTSRFFSYMQGEKSVNKDKIADKLLKLAKSLEEAHDNSISKAGTTLTVTTFDDSGTEYENYDTAAATTLIVSGC